MKMDQLKSWKAARCIAIIECTVAIIGWLFVLLCLLLSVSISVGDDKKADFERIIADFIFFGNGMISAWIITVVATIYVLFSTVAAFFLREATKVETNPKKAFPSLKYWIGLTLVDTLVAGIFLSLCRRRIELTLLTSIKLIFSFIVTAYIREVTEAIREDKYSDDTQVEDEEIGPGIFPRVRPRSPPPAPGALCKDHDPNQDTTIITTTFMVLTH